MKIIRAEEIGEKELLMRSMAKANVSAAVEAIIEEV